MSVNPLDVPDPTGPYQPPSGQRGTGFLTEPLRLGPTPSATVGPYLAIGLTWPDGIWAAEEGTQDGIWIRGRVFDGAGQVVPDAMVETWQADPDGGFPSPEDPRGASSYPGFRGYARAQTVDPPGEYGIFTLKPGRVPDGEGGLQAPHIDVSLFARGILDRVVTRIYFADEAEANAEDVVLRGLSEDQRATLIAEKTDDGYRLDLYLQGDRETVFFAVSARGLFDGTFARGGAAPAVSDDAWFRALLEVEAALARAAAGVGLVPTTAADAVTKACADPSRLDLAAVVAKAADAGNPVPPLVRALQDAVGPEAARAVHVAATSQDVLDTALVLLARNAIGVVDADLTAAAATAARLAETHRDDVVLGRTLMQQALPTTFGLKAAGWLAGLDGARLRLAEVVASLPVQYGGAVGTLAGSAPAVRTALAAELGLADTPVAWHTVRLPIADLAGALGAAAGVVATVALDVVLMAQTEIGELAEVSDGRGGSSAMPHKSNPVAAISARACARRAPGLVATLLAAMEQEHERAAGAWHSEWPTLTGLLTTVGSAASWLAESLTSLRVDTARMAATAAASGEGALARALAAALEPSLGAGAAHDAAADVVRQARETGRPLRELLAGRPEVDVDSLAPDVGDAGAQVDAVLAEHRRLTEGTA